MLPARSALGLEPGETAEGRRCGAGVGGRPGGPFAEPGWGLRDPAPWMRAGESAIHFLGMEWSFLGSSGIGGYLKLLSRARPTDWEKNGRGHF